MAVAPDYVSTAQTITRAAAFAGLAPSLVDVLAREAILTHYQSDETLVRQGKAVDALHLVIDGELVVVADGELRRRDGPGDLFGAGAWSGAVARESHVTASPTSTLSWRRETLKTMLAGSVGEELRFQLATRLSVPLERARLLSILGSSSVFRGTSPSLLGWLVDSATMVPYRRGDVIFRKGEPGDSMAVIVDGEADVYFSGEAPPGAPGDRVVLAGECLGEIALIQQTPRMATVVARQESHLLVIGRDAFAALCRDSQAFRRTVASVATERMLSAGDTAERDVVVAVNGTTYPASDVLQHAAAYLSRTFGDRVLVATLHDGPDEPPRTIMPGVQAGRYRFAEGDDPGALRIRLAQVREVDLILVAFAPSIQERAAPAFLDQASTIAFLTRSTESVFPYRSRTRKFVRHFVVGRGAGDGFGRRAAVRIDLGDDPGALTRPYDRLGFAVQAGIGRLARALVQREVGIALGGGGGWGWAHLPLLSGLHERGIPIDMVAGVSFGACVGASYASMGLEGLEKLLAHRSVIAASPLVAVYMSWPMATFFRYLLEHERFEDLPTPLFVVATDILAAEAKVFRRGSIGEAVRASCSLPGTVGPTVINGHRYVDGCVVDNVPVGCLREEGADFVISSNVVLKPAPMPPDASDNTLQRLLSLASPVRRWQDSIRSFYLQAHVLGERSQIADVEFRPDLSAFPIPDYAQARSIIAAGARDAPPVLDEIVTRFRALGPRAVSHEPSSISISAEAAPAETRSPSWNRRPEVRQDGPADFYLRNYLRALRAADRYFRFETEGYETLRSAPTSLIVGYHGRPFAWDLGILSARMYDDLGYYPRTFTARSVSQVVLYREVAHSYGALYDLPDAREMERIRKAGHHLVVMPGGLRECVRPFWVRYKVNFGRRRGYLKFASANDLPIIPVVATGIDDAFLGLNDGYKLSRLLLGNGGYSLWFGVGLGGFYPFALPFPVHIRQRIGPPIDLRPLKERAVSEEAFLEEANQLVVGTMQRMLDDLRR